MEKGYLDNIKKLKGFKDFNTEAFPQLQFRRRDEKDLLGRIEKTFKKVNIENKDDPDIKIEVLNAIAILEKEKIAGIHALLSRIHRKENPIDALEEEMIKVCDENGLPKSIAKHKMDQIIRIWEENYIQDWDSLKERWGFLYIPDAFYPGIFSEKNIISWTEGFIKYFLKSGNKGAKKIINDIGHFLARYNIDAVYNGVPIIYYSIIPSPRVMTDNFGRKYKIYKFPLRLTKKEILDIVDKEEDEFSVYFYGGLLGLKDLTVLKKPGWGEIEYWRKRKRKMSEIDSEVKCLDDLSKGKLYRLIRDRYSDLKKENISDNKCFTILSKEFQKSHSGIRHIVKRHTKF